MLVLTAGRLHQASLSSFFAWPILLYFFFECSISSTLVVLVGRHFDGVLFWTGLHKRFNWILIPTPSSNEPTGLYVFCCANKKTIVSIILETSCAAVLYISGAARVTRKNVLSITPLVQASTGWNSNSWLVSISVALKHLSHIQKNFIIINKEISS